MSFGGPNGPDDVIPFLDNVLRGRNVPEERKLEVAHHYQAFGGVSPINAQNAALRAALGAELARRRVDLPVYLGNRNWMPFVTDVVRDMKAAGVRKFLALVTSGFSCYSGCRQYREDMMRAQAEVGEGAPAFDKIRVWYNHPLFISVSADHWRAAAARIPADRRAAAVTLFTAHSIPDAMSKNCDYVVQLSESCRLTAEAASIPNARLVYQSRSGPPHQPWLEPDVCDTIRELHAAGVRDVIVHPIGFISDHMEVLYDLDHEAKDLCAEIGMNMERAATPGTHPDFVRMLADLVEERIDPARSKPALGVRPPNHDVCPVNCCLSGRPAGGPPGRPVAT